jgi:N-methylhydantoinase A
MIEETGAIQAVTAYGFDRMDPGNVVRGPTVIHSPLTTVVVHNGQVARMEGPRNLILEAA